MKFDSVMIDIETLGKIDPVKGSIPVVSEIGVVFFNAREPASVSCQYGEVKISVEKSLEAGLSTDEDTLSFWERENPQKLQQMIERNGKSPAEALQFLSDGFGSFLLPKGMVWAKSPSFDCNILGAVARKVGVGVPWKYFQERDVRTLMELEGVHDKMFPGCDAYGISDLPAVAGKLHDAIWDSVRQSNQVRSAWALKLKRAA